MLNYFTTPVRAVLLAAILAFAFQAADARAAAQTQGVVATATTARAKTEATENDGVPLGGLLIIAGIVGGLILLAWIASRMSDSRPTMS